MELRGEVGQVLLKVIAFPVLRPEGNVSAAQPPSRYASAGVLHAWASRSPSRGVTCFT